MEREVRNVVELKSLLQFLGERLCENKNAREMRRNLSKGICLLSSFGEPMKDTETCQVRRPNQLRESCVCSDRKRVARLSQT